MNAATHKRRGHQPHHAFKINCSRQHARKFHTYNTTRYKATDYLLCDQPCL